MMAQERSLREELGELASELGASLSAQGEWGGDPSNSCSAGSSAPQPRRRRRLCTTPNTLAGDQRGKASCCWQGIEEPDQEGKAARAVAQRLQQLSEASASSQHAASEISEMLCPVPSIREVSTSLDGSNCSQAEAHMSESLTRIASILHAANSSDDRCASAHHFASYMVHSQVVLSTCVGHLAC